jgi:2-dehydro-3-deoxygluconokinase
MLEFRSVADTRFDIVSLGEVMLRLDPGDGRVRTARSFRAWEGGGEYNVARGLRRCFGLRASIVTALVDNDVGRLVEDLILQGGVDAGLIRWLPFDGVGRISRNGLNFTERGFGVRGALGISDRGHTAVSQLEPGDISWDHLFGRLGVRWFHTGGIFAGLSESTAAVAVEAAEVARRHGTIVSYDLNYRPSIWKGVGGLARARAVNRALVQHVDVLFGNEEDYSACLGIEGASSEPQIDTLDAGLSGQILGDVARAFPNLTVIAQTLRDVHTASSNDWGAVAWSKGKIARATHRPGLEIYDRVGGGDSFASGLIFGLLGEESLGTAIELGVAHGALAMTTPGDTSMASLDEVRQLAGGASARVKR